MSVDPVIKNLGDGSPGSASDTADSRSLNFSYIPANNIETFACFYPTLSAKIMQLEAGIFKGETTIIDLHDVIFFHRKSNLKYFSTGIFPNYLVFSFPLNVNGPYFRNAVHYGELTQIAFNNASGGASVTPRNCDQIWIAIKIDTLSQHLTEEEISALFEIVRPNTQITVAKSEKEKATNFVVNIEAELVKLYKASHQSEISSHKYSNHIIKYMFEYVSHTSTTPVTATDSSSYEKILDRAIRFLYNERGANCSIDRLSKEIFASKRNIQYAFSGLLDMTPSDFARLIRLNLVRKELLGLNWQRKAISHVLQKYNISNSGRFRHEYYDFFKEFPKDTVARSNS